ncbi:glycoside-pentoside-hexuronide (GPH):cation symporter [Kluyvera georgiana]|uniref:MFS transporter n=1 Tax=Kluyvera georgiana TaxID=73098 RepID=UPI00321FAFDD
METKTASPWRLRLGFSVADISCNLVWQLISLYLMYFYTDIMKLPAYYIGIMFLITRLADGVTDVLMGILIDNTSTRWGRCRPWLAIGAIPFGLLCILAFYIPDFGTTGKLIWAFITYFLLSVMFTVVNIPYNAMLPFLSNDAHERTVLSSVRIMFSFIGSTIVSVATLPLVNWLGNGNQDRGFIYTATLFGVLSTFFLFVSFCNVKERYTITPEKMTLRRAWQGLKENTPWKVFAINILFMWGAFFLQSGALIYFFKYYVGNTALTSVAAGIASFVPLLGTLTVPFLAKRLRKIQVYQLACAINLGGMVIMMLSGVNVWGLMSGAVLLALGFGQRNAIYFSMQADPVDYGEWKTGINTAGILTSVNGFIGKVAMAAAGALSGFMLSATGYVAEAQQSAAAIMAIKACYLWIPAGLIVVSMLWMGRFYTLDNQYEEIKKQLAEQKLLNAEGLGN